MPVYNKRGILLLPKVIVLNPKDGDLVILDGNPMDDIDALKKVAAVYQDGKKIEI